MVGVLIHSEEHGGDSQEGGGAHEEFTNGITFTAPSLKCLIFTLTDLETF